MRKAFLSETYRITESRTKDFLVLVSRIEMSTFLIIAIYNVKNTVRKY
jgi:hypothetical protein